MSKKIIILIIILVILAGGFFCWWQGQADVRALNQGLPEGVFVKKTLAGQYKVNNRKDGYVVAVPEGWRKSGKIQEVEYNEWGEDELIISEREIGLEGESGLLAISCSRLKQEDTDLDSFVEEWSQIYMPTGSKEKQTIGKFEVIQIKDEMHYADLRFYFFKIDSRIYRISLLSEEFIREIILNSQW